MDEQGEDVVEVDDAPELGEGVEKVEDWGVFVGDGEFEAEDVLDGFLLVGFLGEGSLDLGVHEHEFEGADAELREEVFDDV